MILSQVLLLLSTVAIHHVEQITKKVVLMKTLVLGGCGFIGRHIVKALSDKGIPTVVYDTNARTENSKEKCIYIHGSFTDLDRIENLIIKHEVTHVVHLISTTLPKNSNENIIHDIKSNLIQTVQLLEICVKHKIKRFLFMSSGGTVYGAPTCELINESHPTNPLCSYGINKLAIEKYLALFNQLYALNYVVLRAGNPYGHGQNPLSGQGVIANFIHRVKAGLPLEVWGDGSVVRDYLHVKDLAELAVLSLQSYVTGVFNAGSGRGTSINQLIDMLSNFSSRHIEVLFMKPRSLDVPKVILDCSLAKSTFKWDVKIALPDGIRDCLD